MASIGTFKKSGPEFQGEIVTLSVQTKGAPAIGSTLVARRLGPPGRSAPAKVATISRSSWTIRASPSRSTPTLSRTAIPSTSSGPAAASKMASEQDRSKPRPGRPGGAFARARQIVALQREKWGAWLDLTHPQTELLSPLRLVPSMRKWSRLARRQTHSTDVSDSDTPPYRELPHTDRGGATTSACRIAVFSRERCPSGLGLHSPGARLAKPRKQSECRVKRTEQRSRQSTLPDRRIYRFLAFRFNALVPQF